MTIVRAAPDRNFKFTALEHDPEKLQTFRIRSCDRTNIWSEIAIQSERISLWQKHSAKVKF